jgi:hypothetical protein
MLDIIEASICVEDRRVRNDLPATLTRMCCPECGNVYVVITVANHTSDFTPTCLDCRELKTPAQAMLDVRDSFLEMRANFIQELLGEVRQYRRRYQSLHQAAWRARKAKRRAR